MPDPISALPRDANGIVIGAWRLRHRRDDFNGNFGPISFRGGVSTTPAVGAIAHRLFVLGAAELTFEPWDGPYPAGWAPPAGVPLDLPPEVAERFRAAKGDPAPPNPAPLVEPAEPRRWAATEPSKPARKPIRR